MITNVLLFIFIILTVSISISYYILYKQLTQTSEALAKLIIVSDFLNNTNSSNQQDIDTSKESFIKFLSDSRDWAFQYIEEVQDGLGKFINDVDPVISHFDDFGDVLSKERPDYQSLKTISNAFKELKTLLPKDDIQ